MPWRFELSALEVGQTDYRKVHSDEPNIGFRKIIYDVIVPYEIMNYVNYYKAMPERKEIWLKFSQHFPPEIRICLKLLRWSSINSLVPVLEFEFRNETE